MPTVYILFQCCIKNLDARGIGSAWLRTISIFIFFYFSHARFHIKFATTPWTPHISFSYTSFNSLFCQCWCRQDYKFKMRTWWYKTCMKKPPPQKKPPHFPALENYCLHHQMILSCWYRYHQIIVLHREKIIHTIKWLYCIKKGFTIKWLYYHYIDIHVYTVKILYCTAKYQQKLHYIDAAWKTMKKKWKITQWITILTT